MQQTSEPTGGHLVLVTGAGRSGTSTVAGALHHLGLHVPLPVLKTNESNPRGFFESTWPLWFHRRIMDAADIEQVDGRPGARELMHAAADQAVQDELVDWLRGVTADASQIVVKDPRASWVPHLWVNAAAELSLSIGFVTMLRHPAEVLGSRSTYYGRNRKGQAEERSFAVLNLAGWVNQTINTEQLTRGQARTWIRYDDLLEDWRGQMRAVRQATGVDLNHSLEPGVRHAVDDFIDPGLRRHEGSFADLDLPGSLTEIAEELWAAGNLLADRSGSDPEAEQRFDAAATAYATLFADSAAIAQHEARARVRAESQEAEARLRKRVRKARREGVAQGRAEALAERRGLVRRTASAVRRRLRRGNRS
ncbi:hypothetical protein ncot_17500 [Nocardioides sp. JQ2195]|uniref:sulfotransferase family protein n=1 Tax=Nocardioides sp. JQ2195 TaxID=2592334 RepID=UPI00143EC3FD|nr:sulfotransferase [Nocardioides sp. JQ2195]QIX28184.1 hypothetical protein ncot_17500 [Nocardioides sp. JQ2195]